MIAKRHRRRLRSARVISAAKGGDEENCIGRGRETAYPALVPIVRGDDLGKYVCGARYRGRNTRSTRTPRKQRSREVTMVHTSYAQWACLPSTYRKKVRIFAPRVIHSPRVSPEFFMKLCAQVSRIAIEGESREFSATSDYSAVKALV